MSTEDDFCKKMCTRELVWNHKKRYICREHTACTPYRNRFTNNKEVIKLLREVAESIIKLSECAQQYTLNTTIDNENDNG